MKTPRASELRHVRPVNPLEFPSSEPESERMGQSTRHHALCMALYQILREAVGAEHTVASDAFVYFDASNPRRKLAPDGMVKLGTPHHDFESYKSWEEGTPELCFEVLSPSDTPERWTFEEKLRRYHALGVRELVVFQVDAEPGRRLRVWDRIEHDLVERVVESERTPCVTLGLMLLLGPTDGYPVGLRLARDVEGRELIPTSLEARARAEADAHAARREAEAAQRDAEAAQRDAEKRVAELEAMLRRLGQTPP